MRLQGNFENNLATAFNLINTGKIDDAISLFENITKSYPNTAKGFHFKAFAYTKKNDFDKALLSIDEAKILSPDSLDISLDKSNILNSLGKTDTAIELLKSIEKKYTKDARVFYNLGCLFMDKKKYDDAVEYFKKTIQITPENKQASFNIGISLFNSSKFELAIDVFKAYQKDYGQDFEAERYISLSYYSLDKLEDAEKSLQILAGLKPNSPSIWFDRGVVLAGLRKNYDAINCYQKTLELSPEFNSAFWNMAILYQREGKIQELLELYEKSKDNNSNCHTYNCHLAQVYLLADELKDALLSIDKSINIYSKSNGKDNRYIELLLIKGNVLSGLEDFKAAESLYKEAISLNDSIDQPYIKLGNALLNSDKAGEAIPYLERAIEINPNFALTYTYLGNAYYMLGNKEKSLNYFKKAQELDPQTSSVALSTQAMAQLESGNHGSAILSLIESIKKDPYNPNAYINLSVFFRDKNKPKEAISWLKKGIVILKSQPYKDKKLATCYTNLGYCYLDIDKYKDMKEAMENALKHDISHQSVAGYLCYSKLFTADWSKLKYYKNLTISMINENKNVSSPFCTFSISDDPELQKKVAINYSKMRMNNTFIGKKYSFENNKNHKKPRVAYLSNDFHDHATMQLMAGFFENHNNKDFDYYAISYDTTPDSNDISKRVEKAFKNFYYVPEKSNEQIAELIHKLEIDIVVDLKGYTYGTRMEILAHRPAPIQISYLGYPGTTGTNYIDYAFLDNYVVTKENEKYFSEKVIKLDGCYQVTDNNRKLPLIQNRSKFGLPNDKFIFCSFNNPYKIQPYIFKIWLDILKEKKDSILWMLCNEENTKKSLQAFAEKRGISKERIIFCNLTTNVHHMQRLTCADLMLDTFPVCSHTTASDALWAGLPLVTLSGRSMVSRVAGSILKEAGLEELITSSLKEYKFKILNLANNPSYLRKIKQKVSLLKECKTLFNTEKKTKGIEEQYKILFNNFKKEDSNV